MPYLLDTNALSEIDKPEPNKGFIDWFNQAETSELYVSCITFGELYKGIELLANTAKRNRLERHTVEIIEAFSNRILIIDLNTTLVWSKLMATSVKKGQTAPSIDALIASQSIQHNLVLVTRNIKDFEQFTDLVTYCPWN
ncbi:MAG TPA: type II toxin-antitoxin system VapC family toxin [Candidatus Saccharimonadales bacterium]|nr:type II toxin-antitoxin system VapC family toxin [Candidatus Saccharimonadales bacterium]